MEDIPRFSRSGEGQAEVLGDNCGTPLPSAGRGVSQTCSTRQRGGFKKVSQGPLEAVSGVIRQGDIEAHRRFEYRAIQGSLQLQCTRPGDEIG